MARARARTPEEVEVEVEVEKDLVCVGSKSLLILCMRSVNPRGMK